MSDLKFSILVPAYNGAGFIGATLRSILSQSFTNYEMIVVDDNSGDGIEDVVKSLRDARIKFYGNRVTLGYPGNLEECKKRATGDILYLMGQDDILEKDALMNTRTAFEISEDIGAVTRPYYWFDENVDKPVRAKKQLNPERDEIVRITDPYPRIIRVFQTLDQLSGLALRKKYVDMDFHEDIFPCHVYPFASIFKKHPIVFLKDYNVAVRIATSQTRSLSSIYDKSPMQSWVDLFRNVFYENEFEGMRRYCIKNFVAKNFVGLVQIKNYGRFKCLLREIALLVKYRWRNLFDVRFWFFSLGTLVMPRSVLRPLADFYKERIFSSFLRDVRLGDAKNKDRNATAAQRLYYNRFLSRIFHTLVYCLSHELKDCRSVLDLGCGPDSPVQHCGASCSIGVDAFEPYIEQSKKKKIHHEYVLGNITKIEFKPKSFDAVIMIESLEHLDKEQGRALLGKIEKWARKKVIVTTPNGYLPGLDSNPLQSHRSGWTVDEMRARGYKVYGMAGWKFLRKKDAHENVTQEDYFLMCFKPKCLWYFISAFTQLITYYCPKFSFGILCIKPLGSR